MQVTETMAKSEEAAASHDGVAHDAEVALAELLTEAKASDVAELQQLTTKAAAEALMAAGQVKARATDLETTRALDEQLSNATELRSDLQQLANLLRNSTFIGKVLALRSHALLVAAAQRLREMTGHRYAFAEGFEILDQQLWIVEDSPIRIRE